MLLLTVSAQRAGTSSAVRPAMLQLVLIPTLIAAALFVATLGLRRAPRQERSVLTVPAELQRLPPGVVPSAALLTAARPQDAETRRVAEVPSAEEPAKLCG